MESPQQLFDRINSEYMKVHQAKEEMYWSFYMGTSDDQDGFSRTEAEWKAYISDSSKIDEINRVLEALGDDDDELRTGLEGWLALFSANTLDSQEASALEAECMSAATALFARRGKYKMYYTDAEGRKQEGSLQSLLALVRTAEQEDVRKSAHRAMLDLEQWVLENGLLELVSLRNRFARSLGYGSYFDYKVRLSEHMSSEELFAVLDDFELRTRDSNLAAISDLTARAGAAAAAGYNFIYNMSGDVGREMDPYLPFSRALERWLKSFGRLNIDYSGADLTLDLLDREGKYQNGFCHSEVPAYYDRGTWVPGKINFTSNARPDIVGSGQSGIKTFFHEGGHAAHFANIKMNAPCFSQEFAPTSMAYAETQSMFCDSILKDADWLKSYAADGEGNPIPDDLIRRSVMAGQPMKSQAERMILVVPYFERALYEFPEDQLTPAAVTALARETEKRILGLEVSSRPLLAIPHILSHDASCSYQGYLLAHMAVYQTRAYFLKRFGYISDNPEVGSLLAEHYWKPGNSLTHDETLRSLTGEGFNARYLADECNLSADQAWTGAEKQLASLSGRPEPVDRPLNAAIRVVDGAAVLADNSSSDEEMCRQFERIIEERYTRKV